MVFFVFLFGVLAGMAIAALIWIGASTAVLIVGTGLLLLLCGLLSSTLALLVAAPDGRDDEATTGPGPVRTGKAR